MESRLRDSILSAVQDLNSWSQKIVLPGNNSTFKDESLQSDNGIDISSAVGSNASTPHSVDATSQPDNYPSRSKYRFNTFFKGARGMEQVKTYLTEACAAIGVDLISIRGKKSTGRHRKETATLHCHCEGDVKLDDSQFDDGCYSKRDTKTETVKETKTSGQLRGVEDMLMKDDRGRRRKSKKAKCNNKSPNEVSEPAHKSHAKGYVQKSTKRHRHQDSNEKEINATKNKKVKLDVEGQMGGLPTGSKLDNNAVAVGNKRSFETMENVSSEGRTKKKTSTKQSAVYSANQPKKRRTETDKSDCNMKITFFRGNDDYIYLSSNSVLKHNGHPHIPPTAKKAKEKNVTDDGRKHIAAMSEAGISPSQIASVMQKLYPDQGEFLSATIQNMSEKIRKCKDELEGVTVHMSSAEKAISYLDSNKISYVLVYDDPESGLMVTKSAGRPTKAEKLKTTEQVEEDIRRLRSDLSFGNDSKLVLLLSIATDDMIRLCMMFPEVFFMDCTAGTNKQRRTLFVMAIKDSEGKCFPCNLSVLPSGQQWVFQFLYEIAFKELYGETTLSRVRLALTDEDPAEYAAFLACISRMNAYQKATLMLCNLHAVWKPFREQVAVHLPKGKSGKLDPEVKKYGDTLIAWIMRQCTYVESKTEYELCHRELNSFLSDQRTEEVVGSECVAACRKLIEHLRTKEPFLANYVRLFITNCLDAMTTSPVEIQNNVIKHGENAVNAKMNVDKTIKNATKSTDSRLEKQHHKAIRAMGKKNLSSRAPTKDHIGLKGQRLADANYDARMMFKGVMIDHERWHIWNFNENISKKDKAFPMNMITRFVRVREVKVIKKNDLVFLRCSCGFYERVGIPCVHIFYLVDDMHMSMFHVRYLKAYNAKYGDPTELGSDLVEAQRQHVINEENGVLISEDILHKICNCNDNDESTEYPILCKDTQEGDVEEARFVLSQGCCTRKKFSHWARCKHDNIECDLSEFDNCGEPFDLAEYKASISEAARMLQDRLRADISENFLYNTDERHQLRSLINEVAEKVIYNDNVGMDLVNRFKVLVQDAASTILREANSQLVDNSHGQSDSDAVKSALLSKYNSRCSAISSRQDSSRIDTLTFVAEELLSKKHKDSDHVQESKFEFAAEESLPRKIEPRLRNGLL